MEAFWIWFGDVMKLKMAGGSGAALPVYTLGGMAAGMATKQNTLTGSFAHSMNICHTQPCR